MDDRRDLSHYLQGLGCRFRLIESAEIGTVGVGESTIPPIISHLAALGPPGYDRDPGRRYPVVYALHGFFIGAEEWTHEIHVPQTIEGAFAKGSRPMIVVVPDSKTLYGGSMYSSSVTTGDFERFIAHDLVAYIDAHYRTIAARESRGSSATRWAAMAPRASG